MSAKGLLYQEQFDVKETSKKFDHVARLSCRLADESYEMALDLDVNSDLCPLENGDRFTLALAKTLSPDGAMDTGHYDQSRGASLMDEYDYVMYGKIYKWKQEYQTAPIEVHVSFGGLLMRLKGDFQHLSGLKLDSRVYLLLRKISQAGDI